MEAHYASTYVALYSRDAHFSLTSAAAAAFILFFLHERCIELLLRAALAEHIHNSAQSTGIALAVFHFDAPKEHQLSLRIVHTQMSSSLFTKKASGEKEKKCTVVFNTLIFALSHKTTL